MAGRIQHALVSDTFVTNGDILVPVSVAGSSSVPVTASIWNSILRRMSPHQSMKLSVKYRTSSAQTLEWETTYVSQSLYIEVPPGRLSDSSKDAFAGLLVYAAEVLRCNRIVIYFSRERSERDMLIRTFISMGMFAAPLGSPLLHFHDASKIYMVSEISEP